jgi:NADH-quinone oxidoreductase subunit N
MGSWSLLVPEVVLLVGALLALFGERLPGGDSRVPYWGAGVSALAALAAINVAQVEDTLFDGMLAYDGGTAYARIAIALLTAVYLLWLGGRGMGGRPVSVATSLVLFSTLGGTFLVAANDLIVLYMSLELSTMPAYVLMGYERKNELSMEGALKYFLLSLLTSLILVYGLSFVYGYAGTTAYSAIDLSDSGPMAVYIGMFVLVGFMAKLSAAPFHYWTPDAYAGASPASVAYVSTVPKVSGLVALVVLMSAVMPQVPALAAGVALAAAASMVLGNLAAFPQTDMRRLMAYSGIAHTGYLLMGVAAGTVSGGTSAVFYAVAYAVPSLGVMLVFADYGVDLDKLGGLAGRRPWAAAAIVAFFLSLIGIPPTVGFFGKLYLFGATLAADYLWLVILALVVSVASLGYYFRVVQTAFFGEGRPDAPNPGSSRTAGLAVALCLAVTLIAGIAARPLMSLLGLTLG